LLEHGGVADAVAPVFSGNGGCCLEKLACLLAAAVHDHEHLGLNNEFLVRTRHSRATTYNDQHVNEHHHVASAFAVLHRPECNFLADMPEDDFRQLRNIVIELVLGTDMAKGGSILKSFQDTFGVATDSSTPSPSSPVSKQDAILLLQMAMKCADLGHLALPWDVHQKWVVRVQDEFFAQGDKEKAAGLPVSFMMDRSHPGCSKSQTGFFKFVALPLVRSLAEVAPAAQPMLDAAVANYRNWEDEENAQDCISMKPTQSLGSDCMTAIPSDGSDSISMTATWTDASDRMTRMTSKASTLSMDSSSTEASKPKKTSGRKRQRAAKYWASVRCRTPSPEPCLFAQRC
jgi:hypothetical protein